jgi:hypothetical protein
MLLKWLVMTIGISRSARSRLLLLLHSTTAGSYWKMVAALGT